MSNLFWDLGFDSYKMRIGYQDLPIDLQRVEKTRGKTR